MANDTRSSQGSKDDEDNRRKKLKSEESAKQLMQDSMETSRREKQHPHTVGFKKKMDGRTYKSLLKLKRRRDTDPDFNEELKRPEAISKIASRSVGGSVSKAVDDREDGGENLASHVDDAASPLSKRKRDNIAGFHVSCSERPRGQILRNNPEVGSHEVAKKFGKVVINGDSASSTPRLREGPGDERGDSSVPFDEVSQLLPRSTDSNTNAPHTSHASDISLSPEVHKVKSMEETGLSDVQKSFDVLLNPEIPKLCEVLQLSEDVKVMVRRFLEHVVENYEVDREQISVLQAFQISLCWIAASLRGCEIDKKASLALAKQHLNFDCTEEEANNMHSALRLLKKRFKSAGHDFASDRLISHQEQVPNREEKMKELMKSIKRIEKKRDKKIMKLNLKYQEEIQEFNKPWKEESAKLEKYYNLDLALVRSIHRNDPVRSEKLKRTEEKYLKVREELEQRKRKLLGELEAKHLAEISRVRKKAESSLLDKSRAEAELYGPPLSEAVPQYVPDKVVVGGEIVEILSPGIESNGEPDQIADLVVPLDPLAIQKDAAISPTNVGSLEESSLWQPVNTLAQAGSSPQILALHGGTSNSRVGGDAQASENQGVLLQAKVVSLHSTGNGLTDQTTDDEAFIEQVRQVQVSDSTQTHDGGQTNNEEELLEHVERLQSSKFTEIQMGDAKVSAASRVEQLPTEWLGDSQPFQIEPDTSENIDLPQQVVVCLNSVDNGSSDQTNMDEALPEVVERLQSSKFTEIQMGDTKVSAASGVEELPTEGLGDSQPFQIEPEASVNIDLPQQVTNMDEALPEVVERLQSSKFTEIQMGDEKVSAASGVEELPTELGDSQPFQIEPEASENIDLPEQVVVSLNSVDNGSSDQTNMDEALPEVVERLQSSKFTEIQKGDAKVSAASGVEELPTEGLGDSQPFQIEPEASENIDLPEQVVVSLNSVDNGSSDQPNMDEALPEVVERLQSSKFTEIQMGDAKVSAASGVEELPTEELGDSQPFQIEPEASENIDLLQQVVVSLNSVDNGSSDQTNMDETLPEVVERLQSSKFTEIQMGDAIVSAASGVEELPTEGLGDSQPFQIEPEASENIDLPQQVVVSLNSVDNGSSDQTKMDEALPEVVERLQSSKFTEIQMGDAKVSAASRDELLPTEGLCDSQSFQIEPEASENIDLPQQVVVSLSSVDNGSSDQTNMDEALPEVVELLQTSISIEIHGGDTAAGVNQDGRHKVEVVPCHPADAGPTVQANHRETLVEGVQQLQMSTYSDSPVDHHYSGSCAAFVPLHSMDSGSTDQMNNREALPEHLEHDRDEEARESQDTPQQAEVVPFHPVDTRPTVQTNQEEALEGVQQLQISSFNDSSVDHNDVLSASGVEQLPSEGRGASQPSENESGALDELGVRSGEILELPPQNKDVTLGPHLNAVENDHPSSSQGFICSQDAEGSSRPVQGTAWVPHQAVSLMRLGLHPPLEGVGTQLAMNSAPQMASQMLTQPFYADPLLKESDRVHKEKEKTIKIYEDVKSSLKSEFEKELQEAIAGIRGKYDDKFRNAESTFLLKKKELDSNMKMVLMNKFLADAFQSKCHALLRPQQGVPSNIMQQHIPSSRPAHGSSHVSGSASGQSVHHLSPPCSTTPAGSPLIVPMTPPTGNLRASAEIRAPAPHLQWSRPSSSMPSTSISSVAPRGVFPFQLEQINLPTASASVPHVRMTSPSVPYSTMTSPLIPHAPLRYDCARQSEVIERTREILSDHNNQPGGPNILRPLNFPSSLGPSVFGSRMNGGGGVVADVAGSGSATDVVCLSDDD